MIDKNVELSNYKGARVTVLTVGDEEEMEGRVEQATEDGIVLKFRGTKALLLERSEIESIQFIGYETGVRPSKLRWPKKSTVRKHLATYHGFGLSVVNAMSNDRAKEIHDELHRRKDAHDFGHFHSQSDEENGEIE